MSEPRLSGLLKGVLRPVAAGVVLTVLVVAAILLLRQGPGTYPVSVYFAKTPSLYEQSRVLVMGADVGRVTGITVEGRQVRVDLKVRSDVPLPEQVRAAIQSNNTLGERNVVLYPPWRPELGTARPGTVIPAERTELPVEIDEALDAFTSLAESLDPGKVGSFVTNAAETLDDAGADINAALQSTARLMHDLAGQDAKLIELAKSLNHLAARVNSREAKFAELVSGFTSVSRQLSEERDRLTGFLAGLEFLVRKGDVVVAAYEEQLPRALDDMAEVIFTLKANSDSMIQAVKGLSTFVNGGIESWDRESNVITIRIQMNAGFRTWWQPLFSELGFPEFPCSPPPFGNCVEGPDE